MWRNVRVHLSCLCVLLLVCSFFAVPAWGQSDVGTIVGFVRDHSGAVVPGARVTIQNEGTARSRLLPRIRKAVIRSPTYSLPTTP